MWNILLFLGAAAIGFGVADDRSAVVLIGALVLLVAGVGRDFGPGGKEHRDRRPVSWPRLLVAGAILLALGVLFGVLDAPGWVVLIFFAAVGAAACTRPVDEWIHEGRPAQPSRH